SASVSPIRSNWLVRNLVGSPTPVKSNWFVTLVCMAYDAAATRRRILAAATAEFAAHGVAGARVDRIAANAQANKRAIYDYFGDKRALFAAVLEQQLSQVAEAVPITG